MIDDKTAKMAINTISKYCDQRFGCSQCAIRNACRDMYKSDEDCTISGITTYYEEGYFKRCMIRPPKFDVRQKDSADFRKYINEIFLREAEKYGLPMNTANSIKWSANGKIKVTFVDDDATYVGVAKCHPDDAFNPEIGIKLAIERAAQVMHTMNDMNKYERTIPKAGEKWMHFKGHVYEIIGFGNHTERMELVVIYREAGDCIYWVRPLEKFMSKVDHNKYPDVPYKWRFWKVSDAEQ